MTTRGHDLVTHDPNGRSCDFAQHHRECDIFCVAMTDVMQGAGAYADPPVTQFDFVLNVDTPPQPVEVGDARFARHN